MSLILQRQIDLLKKMILSLGTLVEESVALAIKSLDTLDREEAQRVAEADAEIDRREIEVEEECLKTLALHQPVAADLRFIVAILKMNNDLERIGDLAVNICHKAVHIVEEGPLPIEADFGPMGATTCKMLRDALDAMIRLDADLAHRVCASDDAVDAMKSAMRARVLEGLRRAPERAEALIAALGATRNLERIADLATNIAEDVLYLIEGEIARHDHSDV